MQVEYSDVCLAIENCELSVEQSLYADYSGRAMYGSQCLGFVGTLGDCFDFVIQLTDILDDAGWCNNARYDNMGTDMIWYWPEVTVVNISVPGEPYEDVEDDDRDTIVEHESRVRPDGPDHGDFGGLIGQGEY